MREIRLEGEKAKDILGFLSERYASKGSFLKTVNSYQFGVFVWDKYYIRIKGSLSATIIYESSEPSRVHILVIGAGGRYGPFTLGSESAIEEEVLAGIEEYAGTQGMSVIE